MIREIKENDIDKVMKIWLDSTIKGHPFLSEEYWKGQYDKVRNVYLPMATTYIYEEAGNVKGFISIIDKNFIGGLFIKVDSQGSGLGSSLIKHVQDKYDKIELAVYTENENAIAFYKKQGFTIQKEGINAESGDLEYVMEWSQV